MNALTIIVWIILILFGIRGYKNGLVKGLVSSFSLIITIVLVSYLTPYVTQFVREKTQVYSVVAEQCEKHLSVKMDEVSAGNKADGTISKIQEAMIDQLQLPDFLKKELIKNNRVDKYKEIGVKNFNEYVPKFIADLIVKSFVFIVTWIGVCILLYIIVTAMKLVTELPAINGFNRVLGVGLGIIQGVIFVWLMFMFITMIGGSAVGSHLLMLIADDKFLEFLYDTNLVLHLIQSIAASVF